jgi:hypothetical protein
MRCNCGPVVRIKPKYGVRSTISVIWILGIILANSTLLDGTPFNNTFIDAAILAVLLRVPEYPQSPDSSKVKSWNLGGGSRDNEFKDVHCLRTHGSDALLTLCTSNNTLPPYCSKEPRGIIGCMGSDVRRCLLL